MDSSEEIRKIAEEKLPESCEEHQPKYLPDAWKNYELQELGNFVHLLAKRAMHRKEGTEKRAKDIQDAKNYLAMMQAKLDALE